MSFCFINFFFTFLEMLGKMPMKVQFIKKKKVHNKIQMHLGKQTSTV